VSELSAEEAEAVPDPAGAFALLVSDAVRVPTADKVVSAGAFPEFVSTAFPQPARRTMAEQTARMDLPAQLIFLMSSLLHTMNNKEYSISV
jgi:hypothetical protein